MISKNNYFKSDLLSWVFLTLAYYKQFDYPLTSQEVWRKLVFFRASLLGVVEVCDNKDLSQSSVDAVLAELNNRGLIDCCDGYWFINLDSHDGQSVLSATKRIKRKKAKRRNVKEENIQSSNAGALILKRLQKNSVSAQKLGQAKKAVDVLRLVPGVLAIGVTGSVGAGGARAGDDIDFLIITRKHFLWIVRFVVFLIALVKQKKRNSLWQEQDSWCLNLWLSESSMSLAFDRRNLYTAKEISGIKFLYSYNRTAEKFYLQNCWVSDFLPNLLPTSFQQRCDLFRNRLDLEGCGGERESFCELKSCSCACICRSCCDLRCCDDVRDGKRLGFFLDLIFPIFVAGINFVFFVIQYAYMLPKKTQEKVSYSSAFFHPYDSKKTIMKNLHTIVLKTIDVYKKGQRANLIKDPASHQTQDLHFDKNPHAEIDKNLSKHSDRNITPTQIVQSLIELRSKNKKIVLVTGVFDLLHSEHLALLQSASELGDVLVVGIESDERVKILKGEGRPFHNQNKRLEALKKISCVDLVFCLPISIGEKSVQRAILELIRPDFLAVSSHTLHQEIKRKLVQEVGGKLVVVRSHNPDVSTSVLASVYKQVDK